MRKVVCVRNVLCYLSHSLFSTAGCGRCLGCCGAALLVAGIKRNEGGGGARKSLLGARGVHWIGSYPVVAALK